jgi:hypothetical protein
MADPLSILTQGLKIFPAPARYAFMVAVFAAAIAIAGGFFRSPVAGFLAAVAALIPVALILLFVTAQGLGARLGLPALVFVWFILLLFMAFSTMAFTSFFFSDIRNGLMFLLLNSFPLPRRSHPIRSKRLSELANCRFQTSPST